MRFSLKALLMLVTALVLLLCYAQHRRRWILATSDELTREGFVFIVPDAWHDSFWQRNACGGARRRWHIGLSSARGFVRCNDHFGRCGSNADEKAQSVGGVPFGTFGIISGVYSPCGSAGASPSLGCR